MGIQEILNDFQEIKDFEGITKIYKNSKAEIKLLYDEIEELKMKKKNICLTKFDDEINSLEDEINEIEKELQMDQIMNGACLNLKDLKKVIQNCKSTQTCKEKILNFLKMSILPYKVKEKEGRILKIKKEIENLMKLISTEDYFNDIKHGFMKLLMEELKAVIPENIEISQDDQYILLLIKCGGTADESLLTDDTFNYEMFNSCFSDFISSYKFIMNSTLMILKKNFITSMLEDLQINSIENNSRFIGTNFYINNLDDYILDNFVKRITEFIGDDKAVVLSKNSLSGKYYSIQYLIINNFFKYIKKSTSKRKKDSINHIESMMLKIYEKTPENINDAFIMYSDISHLLKSVKEWKYFDKFNKIKESLFYFILTDVILFEPSDSSSNLLMKAKIKEAQMDFYNLIDNFIAFKMQSFFKMQFFEKIYLNLFDFILENHPNQANENHRSSMVSVIQYLFNISYEIDHENILMYPKMKNLYTILSSSIREVISKERGNEFILSGNQVKKIISNYFEESNEKTSFLKY